MRPRRFLHGLLALALVGVLAILAGCGGDGYGAASTPATSTPSQGFAAVQAEARGQTVRWWMYGGDARINAYVDDVVAPAAKRFGVTLKRVPITDTADAVQRVVAQKRAGTTSGGAVDMIWINGENFAAGKAAGLWLKNWAGGLPNARYLDPTDGSLTNDFQVPVDGQESPWSRAAFVFAYDSAKVDTPPASFADLLAYARANPGRFTYPAPPDFTGSAFVRQVVAALGEDEAFAYLKELKPFMYRKGEVLPKSEAELNDLFSNGQVDIAMSYDANFINTAVIQGQFPATMRPFLIGDGALGNVSFVTIPADAAHAAGAQVVANVLLDPEAQAEKADPTRLGNLTVIDTDLLSPDQRALFTKATGGPYYLSDLGTTVEEFAADEVAPLEKRWTQEILRG